MTRIRCDRTPAWGALKSAFETEGHAFDLRAAFAAEPDRFERFSQDAPHVFADMSKNLIDAETQQLLLDLARQTGVVQHRDAMFSGQAINRTEQRPVMHWLLRNPALATVDAAQSATNNVANEALVKGLASELAQVHRILDAMLSFA